MDKPKVTKYQRLQKAATAFCKSGSPAAKERFNNAAKSYVEDAVKKGKTKAEAQAVVSRLQKCPKK